jgi:uncharacterized cupin superfamily protein
VTAVAHWDEAGDLRRHLEEGHLAGMWTDLGTLAGSVTVGVERIDIDPGKWSTPLHAEGGEEEIFYVLRGSGTALLWDGDETTAHDIGEGDCLVHRALEQGHTLKAGDDGLDVLAFGERAFPAATYLPRAGIIRTAGTWTVVGEGPAPWDREAQAGEPQLPPASERPDTIVNVGQVEPEEFRHGSVEVIQRDLAQAAGSVRTGLQHLTVAPGKLPSPPHCHSAEEEIFVVLDGEGQISLGEDEHPVRPGSVVARPAGTRVAHSFRAGEGGLTLLAYGTRDPNDIAYYPRSNKIFFRGVGVMTRLKPLDYWDGEE